MDIINEIIHDHRRLRELLDQVRAERSTIRAKKLALAELLPLVKAHASAEEKTLYTFARKKRKLKHWALEGFEEHGAATEMGQKARKTGGPDLWLARATVFCEMLENHLDEEEDEFFPEVRKELRQTASAELADRYRKLMPPAETKQRENQHGRSKVLPFLRPANPSLEAFNP